MPFGTPLVDLRMQILQNSYMPGLCEQCLAVPATRVGFVLGECGGQEGMSASGRSFEASYLIPAKPSSTQFHSLRVYC